jgi:hypothetical protein
LDRFVDLAHEATPQKPYAAVQSSVKRNVDLVVHMTEVEGGGRRVNEILEVTNA